MKKLIVLISFALVAVASAAQKNNGIYVMGASISFSDSIVYFTEIQEMDSVSLQKSTKFLPDRQHYAYELKDYMALQEDMPGRTSVILFAKKKSSLEKKQINLKLRLERRRGLKVRYLGDKFQFTRP